jgi:hypothetical protein
VSTTAKKSSNINGNKAESKELPQHEDDDDIDDAFESEKKVKKPLPKTKASVASPSTSRQVAPAKREPSRVLSSTKLNSTNNKVTSRNTNKPSESKESKGIESSQTWQQHQEYDGNHDIDDELLAAIDVPDNPSSSSSNIDDMINSNNGDGANYDDTHVDNDDTNEWGITDTVDTNATDEAICDGNDREDIDHAGMKAENVGGCNTAFWHQFEHREPSINDVAPHPPVVETKTPSLRPIAASASFHAMPPPTSSTLTAIAEPPPLSRRMPSPKQTQDNKDDDLAAIRRYQPPSKSNSSFAYRSQSVSSPLPRWRLSKQATSATNTNNSNQRRYGDVGSGSRVARRAAPLSSNKDSYGESDADIHGNDNEGGSMIATDRSQKRGRAVGSSHEVLEVTHRHMCSLYPAVCG